MKIIFIVLLVMAGTVPAIDCYACACSACKWNTTGDGEFDALAAAGDSVYYNSDTGGRFTHLVALPTIAACPARVGCAGCDSKIKQDPKPLSILQDTISCDSLLTLIYQDGAGAWGPMYTTCQAYIENCYYQPLAPSIFEQFTAAMQQLAGRDTSLWVSSRLWLESVLYLNTTNPEYFCKCVEAIGRTYNSPSDTSETLNWEDLNRTLAIDQWLVDNTTCDTPTIQNGIYGARGTQYSQWLNDTTIPLDTTEPTMQQLGLDTLLERHFLYSVGTPQGILSNISAYPNPTGSGTVISFGIAQEAYVKIELFDVLGHEVAYAGSGTDAGFESLFEPGNKAVPISLAGLPSGTYFARIQTNYGEAQSVKIVKQ